METTVYNPPKGRLETINVVYTKENTTWFDNDGMTSHDIVTITDFDGGILIRTGDSSHSIWVYDLSRADIDYNHKKAQKLRDRYV
jgi:hypothetical protein